MAARVVACMAELSSLREKAPELRRRFLRERLDGEEPAGHHHQCPTTELALCWQCAGGVGTGLYLGSECGRGRPAS